MNLSLLLSQLFNGLQTGSIYALVALGYSMVYGIILLLNFAHGDIIMVGAYAAFYAMTNFHLHPIVSVIIAVITSTLLGVVIEKVTTDKGLFNIKSLPDGEYYAVVRKTGFMEKVLTVNVAHGDTYRLNVELETETEYNRRMEDENSI